MKRQVGLAVLKHAEPKLLQCADTHGQLCALQEAESLTFDAARLINSAFGTPLVPQAHLRTLRNKHRARISAGACPPSPLLSPTATAGNLTGNLATLNPATPAALPGHESASQPSGQDVPKMAPLPPVGCATVSTAASPVQSDDGTSASVACGGASAVAGAAAVAVAGGAAGSGGGRDGAQAAGRRAAESRSAFPKGALTDGAAASPRADGRPASAARSGSRRHRA